MRAEKALALLPGLISEKINVIQAHEFTGRKKITEIQLPGTKHSPERKALRRILFSVWDRTPGLTHVSKYSTT